MIFIESEFIPYYIKLVPVFFSIMGALSALGMYIFGIKNLIFLKYIKVGRLMYFFFNKKWYFDKIYNEFFTLNILSFGHHITFKLIDRGIFEFFGPSGLTIECILDKRVKSSN